MHSAFLFGAVDGVVLCSNAGCSKRSGCGGDESMITSVSLATPASSPRYVDAYPSISIISKDTASWPDAMLGVFLLLHGMMFGN